MSVYRNGAAWPRVPTVEARGRSALADLDLYLLPPVLASLPA
jgi:hypothetical protein